jgi:hypothetical protein
MKYFSDFCISNRRENLNVPRVSGLKAEGRLERFAIACSAPTLICKPL